MEEDELLDALLSQPIDVPPGGYVLRDVRDEATREDASVEQSCK
ncbi:hypothetical protein ACIRVK_43055 [Streptomyces sp. NPDC101152]